MKVRMLRSLAALLLVSLIGAVLWTESFLAQRNVLAFKSGWRLSTIDYLNPTIVGVPAYVSPDLLTGYRLQSNSELGTVRLLSEAEVNSGEIHTWFRLKESGFVDLIFDARESLRFLRLSSSRHYPSGVYEAEETGRYKLFRSLDHQLAPGLYHARLLPGKLELNQAHFGLPEMTPGRTRQGLQVSPGNSEVFFFESLGPEGSKSLHFWPEGNRWSIYLIALLLEGLLIGAGVLVLKKCPVKLATIVSALGLVVFLWSTLLGFNGTRTPEELKHRFALMDELWRPDQQRPLEEKLRGLKRDDAASAIFLCRAEGCQRVKVGTPLPRKTGTRVLIFGGSQSKYGLVPSYEESFHFRLDHYLREKFPRVETIDLSTPGFFRHRLGAYGPSLPNVAPDLVIVESPAMEQDWPFLREFFTRLREKRIPAVFLRTSQNPQRFTDSELQQLGPELRKGLAAKFSGAPPENKWLALRNVPFLRELRDDFGITVLDPNELFLDEKIIRSGQTFWDDTHLTGYGQELQAKWLAQKLENLD